MIEFTTTREAVAFLARRAGWGLAPGRLDELEALGIDGTIDRLVDPTAAGIAEEASAWADWDYDYDRSNQETSQAQTLEAFTRWMTRLVTTERPLDHRLAWFWHDHFAVSLQVVRNLPVVIDHLDLCWSQGRGDFVELIRQVTTDAAMLVFLDGATAAAKGVELEVFERRIETWTWRTQPAHTADEVDAIFENRYLTTQRDIFGGGRGQFTLDAAGMASLELALETTPDPVDSVHPRPTQSRPTRRTRRPRQPRHLLRQQRRVLQRRRSDRGPGHRRPIHRRRHRPAHPHRQRLLLG